MSESVAMTTVEIAHLELSYAHTRIRRPRRIAYLTESLMRYGQLVPIVVVAKEHPHFVLIDGYQRVNAARRAGLDTLKAAIWTGHAQDALCQLLARDGARQFDAFEQAALLRELKITHQLSQNQIAARLGRHPSWVTRRLAIIDELPEAAIAAVRAGELSCWSAARVVVPLARANGRHAQALVAAIGKQPATSRQLLSFWQHYQAANRGLRQKMADQPLLFFKSLAEKATRSRERDLREGPEGRWCRDMRTAGHILVRLDETASQVFYPGQPNLERRSLLTAASDTQSAFEKLTHTIERLAHEDRSRPTNSHCLEGRRPQYPADQCASEDVSKDHPADPGRQSPREAGSPKPL